MINEILKGFGILIAYFAVSGSAALVIKKSFNVTSELFRKMLHLICVMSVFLLLYISATWYAAICIALMFSALVYPILVLAERLPVYSSFFSERSSGEIKKSLILVYLMFTVLTAVFWGWLGAGWKYVITVSVAAWGYGDAAAALVGKRYGRRYIEHRLVDGKKTFEGSFAMLCVAWLAIFSATMLLTSIPWYICLIVAVVSAPLCALTELVSPHGLDTVIVPLSAAACVSILIYFLSNFTGAL